MECKLVRLYWCQHPQDHYVFMHAHEYYELIYYESGNGKSIIDGEIYPIEPGSIALIEPNAVHDEKYASDGELVWCHFLCDKRDLALKSGILKSRYVRDTGLYEVLMRMKRESMERPYDYQRMLDIYLMEVLLILGRIAQQPALTEYSNEIEYAKSFLKNNISRKIDLQILAEHIGYSYDHFRHLFKSKTTITLNRYLLNLRVAKAKEMLESNDELVETIAHKCGFQDTSRFISVFKQETGYTPNRYRQVIVHTKGGIFEPE